MNDDWKKKLGNMTVYSTNPDFKFEKDEDQMETLLNHQQTLIVSIDKKQRKGKTVTLIEGFMGKVSDLEALAKSLKTKCGVGGSAKDGEIVIQGDFKLKIKEILEKEKYKVKLK
ncbi:MAG TPA: translation initiation factor [Chitinophagales bacterium]|jgi:translation initiation factor 1|nr:translation initiation factor [Chitinophagales bacterium]HQW78952.1 translation initiation factor [Chitinophagales bacterium]HRB68231.1 translation initiation factor [Chitinophagales bacterium]